MKNITFSVDETVIERARKRAKAENTSLNEVVRAWLKIYIDEPRKGADFQRLMRSLSYARSGGKFSRDTMNER